MTSAITTAQGHIPSASTFGGSPSSPINRDTIGAMIIVVMGVSGTGKSTLGKALAQALRCAFIDGDDLHPPTNVAKMGRGEPLGDVDRWGWLEAIRRAAVECMGRASETRVGDGDGDGDGDKGARVVVACSALKRTYRAVLRGEGMSVAAQPRGASSSDAVPTPGPPVPTVFVYLKGDREVLMARMVHRQGHFMKADMLASQLDTLESPEGEPGVVTVSVEMSTAEQVQRVVESHDLVFT